MCKVVQDKKERFHSTLTLTMLNTAYENCQTRQGARHRLRVLERCTSTFPLTMTLIFRSLGHRKPKAFILDPFNPLQTTVPKSSNVTAVLYKFCCISSQETEFAKQNNSQCVFVFDSDSPQAGLCCWVSLKATRELERESAQEQW